MQFDVSSVPRALRRYWLGLVSPARRKLARQRGQFGLDGREPGLRNLDREGIVESDGLRLRYYEVGPQDADLTVVFVHGFGLAAKSFFQQVEHLRERHPGVRGVLLDFRGHGRSDTVPPERCTVTGVADDLHAVLAERVPSGRLILVGHSLGGPVIFNLLRRCPPNLHERIAGLVIVSSSFDPFADHGIPQLLGTSLASQAHGVAEAAPDLAERLRRVVTRNLAPGLAVAIYRRPTDYAILEFHAQMFHETPLESYLGFFDDLRDHDELAAGEKLAGIPGYVLLGELDDVSPENHFERLKKAWPEAWLQVGEAAGHMLPLEEPEIVNAAIDRLVAAVGVCRR
ncbi:alpha/beta fold hydrolase [Corynebacterium halotolerans]|uniref:AB hydrolase-1 domain-containing protein n=1 Tax=Corynebacterium halotolerans YIM 70093 = DSM 44683 TaxID=1121362 RepID=M1NZU0_9CORY|nr:alpha/beta hydrolase [Corynebacterium halotolerans]AGF73010.1 hypothetical protein A605_10040 [Corynebacterium halotolerans YIM 70093 = DSM 44683]